MSTRYYPKEDTVDIIVAHSKGGGGSTLRDDFGVILTFADKDSEDITQVDILRVSRFMPLGLERGYDAETDTLTLGQKPDADYRVVDNGDFVSYLQWFDDGSEWDVVALDLRHTTRYLAKVIAAGPQPLDICKC